MNEIETKLLKYKTEKMAENIYIAACASFQQNFSHSFDKDTAKDDMVYAKMCAEFYCSKISEK